MPQAELGSHIISELRRNLPVRPPFDEDMKSCGGGPTNRSIAWDLQNFEESIARMLLISEREPACYRPELGWCLSDHQAQSRP